MTTLTAPKPAHREVTRAIRKRKSLIDRLCEEHTSLASQLGLLDDVAGEVGRPDLETIRRDVDRAYDFLAQKVLPHMKTEGRMRMRLAAHDRREIEIDHDHSETKRLVAVLGKLKAQLALSDRDATTAEIRHVLYELHALTRLHFVDQIVAEECAEAPRGAGA